MRINNLGVIFTLVSTLLSGCASREDKSSAKSVEQTSKVPSAAAAAPDSQPKPKIPKYVRQNLEPAKPIAGAEVSSLSQAVITRMSPFTLDEVRKGIPSANAARGIQKTGSAGSIGKTTRQRRDGERVFSITAITRSDGETLLRADFYMKEGSLDLSDQLKGTIGKQVLTLRTLDTEASNSIGFREVLLVDDEVYSLYQKSVAGKWSVEKYKMDEEQQ